MAVAMIDALAHLHDPRLATRLGDILQGASAQGVTDIVSANAPAGWLPDASKHPVRLWRAVGVHPQHVTPQWKQTCEVVREHADARDVVAIGEIGLDDRDGMPEATLQEAAFMAQWQLARARELPFIVHCVGRLGHLVDLLTQHGPHPSGFAMHGFAGPAELVAQLVDLGAYFSFGGLVTRPAAKKCHKAAAMVPQDRLLVESDAPDMPAAGWGRLSTPAMLSHVLAALGHWRQVAPEVLASATFQNARRLYKMAHPSNMEPV